MIFTLLHILVTFCKENAVIVILCRNSDLSDIKNTIKNFEDRFNKEYKYPYVFLNDKLFTHAFISEMGEATDYNSSFGLIEPEDWDMPNTIDRKIAEKNWSGIAKSGVPYVQKESYHNMCRYYSRGFYKHPLLTGFDYYWRIEPGVKYHCDIPYDPFKFMKENNKKYGFVITLHEFMESIPTLMKTTAEFVEQNYSRIKEKNNPKFMFFNGKYNGCHFWSNFEIASFDFLRSDLYNDYVDYLEKSGGFYYERWGDAPVHSIAASLFLDKREIHFFEDIGYTHDSFMHCPKTGKNCNCEHKDSIDFTPYSCLTQYLFDLNDTGATL